MTGTSSSDDFIPKFLRDAKTAEVNNQQWTSTMPATPKWVKPHLIRAGQEFIQQHFFAIYFSHFVSLLLLFCYEPIRVILLRTEKSAPSSRSLRRYFSTLSHLRNWYQGNLLDEQSPTSLDIQSIRQVHVNVAKTMESMVRLKKAEAAEGQQLHDNLPTAADSSLRGVNGRDVNNNETPAENIVIAVQRDFIQNRPNFSTPHKSLPLPPYTNDQTEISYPAISQLDMIITQFCFMGLISLYPRVFGITGALKSARDGGDDGLAGFLHLWALIGHRLGIEDRFNLCLDSNEQQLHAKQKQKILIAQDVYLHTLVSVADPGADKRTSSTAASILVLWQSLVSGIATFIPFVSLPAMLAFFMLHILGFKSTANTSQFFTLYDRLCLQIMNACFNSWLWNTTARHIFNQLLRLALILTSIRLYYLVPAIRMLKKLSVH